MPIYKPSELMRFMDELGIAPQKRLSQNFLLDGNILRKIIELAHVQEGDVVLEIGPGPGALTELLLEKGAFVIAVEKDPILARELSRFKGNLEVHCEDILCFPMQEALQKYQGKVKVIANLPYHLTTPIITELMPRSDLFSEVVVMVQEEVAQRFVSDPGRKEYGALSVFLRFYSEPKYGFKVSRHCFHPQPKVDSAIVRFKLHKKFEHVDSVAFFTLTRTAFSQRRKMLSKNLKSLYPKTPTANLLSAMGKSPMARPEELSLEEFLILFKACEAEEKECF